MADAERALQIAVQAHAGQKDRNGAAYIFHPIRVMQRCVTSVARIAALLHDVVEDTDITLEDLRKEGFSEEVLTVVQLMTRDEGTPYMEYVERIANHATAVEIKLADLEDNSDIRRLTAVNEDAVERLQKYHHAYQRLMVARESFKV